MVLLGLNAISLLSLCGRLNLAAVWYCLTDFKIELGGSILAKIIMRVISHKSPK